MRYTGKNSYFFKQSYINQFISNYNINFSINSCKESSGAIVVIRQFGRHMGQTEENAIYTEIIKKNCLTIYINQYISHYNLNLKFYLEYCMRLLEHQLAEK